MKKIFALPFFLLIGIASNGQVTLQNLLTENRTNPLGIDTDHPRFSWQLVSDKRNVLQVSCEIRVTAGQKPVWSSGKIQSDQSVHVPYSGDALESGKKYTWQVRAWDQSGKVSAWSESAFWQMGLLKPSDW